MKKLFGAEIQYKFLAPLIPPQRWAGEIVGVQRI